MWMQHIDELDDSSVDEDGVHGNDNSSSSERERYISANERELIDFKCHLLRCLKAIRSNYKHNTRIELPSHLQNPVLEIAGFGDLGLPVRDVDAKTISDIWTTCDANETQNGAGDCSVDLNPGQFQIANETWQLGIEKLARDVGLKFGCINRLGVLRPELRQLSICVSGSTCRSARKYAMTQLCPTAVNIYSTGDDKDICGTLAIFLPSRHTGGLMTFDHLGGRTSLNYGSTPNHLGYGAVW